MCKGGKVKKMLRKFVCMEKSNDGSKLNCGFSFVYNWHI